MLPSLYHFIKACILRFCLCVKERRSLSYTNPFPLPLDKGKGEIVLKEGLVSLLNTLHITSLKERGIKVVR